MFNVECNILFKIYKCKVAGGEVLAGLINGGCV